MGRWTGYSAAKPMRLSGSSAPQRAGCGREGGDQTAAVGITLSELYGFGRRAASGDLYLLACAVHAEARAVLYGHGGGRGGEPREKPAFPNTIAGVIYQPGAPRRATEALTCAQRTVDPCRADAHGWDQAAAPVFYNPAKSTSRWIYSAGRDRD